MINILKRIDFRTYYHVSVYINEESGFEFFWNDYNEPHTCLFCIIIILFPVDETIVTLKSQGNDESQYINASFIDVSYNTNILLIIQSSTVIYNNTGIWTIKSLHSNPRYLLLNHLKHSWRYLSIILIINWVLFC